MSCSGPAGRVRRRRESSSRPGRPGAADDRTLPARRHARRTRAPGSTSRSLRRRGPRPASTTFPLGGSRTREPPHSRAATNDHRRWPDSDRGRAARPGRRTEPRDSRRCGRGPRPRVRDLRTSRRRRSIADVVPAPARPAAYGLLVGSTVRDRRGGGAARCCAGRGRRPAAVRRRRRHLPVLRSAAPRCAAGPGTDKHDGRAPNRTTTSLARRAPWRDRRLLALLGCGVVFAAIYLQVSATLGLTLDQRSRAREPGGVSHGQRPLSDWSTLVSESLASPNSSVVFGS